MRVYLKRSKTDYDHSGITITVAEMGCSLCPVAAMKRLFTLDPQLPNQPLFNGGGGGLGRNFTTSFVRNHLNARLATLGIVSNAYTCYSFRRGAAQHALDCGATEQEIKALGRWTSDAWKLYCTESPWDLYRLSVKFQRGSSSDDIPIPTRLQAMASEAISMMDCDA